MIISKGVSHYKYFRQDAGKYFNFKTIFYQVSYNFSRKPPYFPATYLKYNNFIGGMPLQLDIKYFKVTIFPVSCRKILYTSIVNIVPLILISILLCCITFYLDMLLLTCIKADCRSMLIIFYHCNKTRIFFQRVIVANSQFMFS